MHPAPVNLPVTAAAVPPRRWRRVITAGSVLAPAIGATPFATPAAQAAPAAVNGAAAPAAPHRLEVPTLAVDDTTISLAWHKPDSYADIPAGCAPAPSGPARG